MTTSHLAFGPEGRAALNAGIRIVAGAVGVTLGPAGRAVLIAEGGKPPRLTRDGTRVAQSIELADRFADMGARLIRNAAARTAEEAGDGRSTATVIAAALIEEGIKAVAAGADPVALKRGIDRGVAGVLDALRAAARTVEPGEALARIATLAANGDDEIGGIAAEAVARTGADGVVDVQGGRGRGLEYELVTGVRFDEGYVSPYFMTDPETLLCICDEPLILLHDGKLDRHEPLLGLLEAAVRARRPLVIVAETVEGEALQTLTANKIRGGLRLVATRAPHFGDRRRAALEDAAVLTGATVIAEDKGLALQNAGPGFLGNARRAVISASETLFVEGAGRGSRDRKPAGRDPGRDPGRPDRLRPGTAERTPRAAFRRGRGDQDRRGFGGGDRRPLRTRPLRRPLRPRRSRRRRGVRWRRRAAPRRARPGRGGRRSTCAPGAEEPGSPRRSAGSPTTRAMTGRRSRPG